MKSKANKIVYFVRHGQSVANVSNFFQTADSPLSEEGNIQAKKIAQRMQNIAFDCLISSPLPRAKETAEAIARLTGNKPEYVDLFVERIKPDGLGGRSHDDSDARKMMDAWEQSLVTPGMKVGNGENFDEIVSRADRALEFLLRRKEKVIVVVTHGYFLRTIEARVLLGASLSAETYKNFQARITVDNTGISAIRLEKRYEGELWRLWIHNDHAHLG